LAYEIDPNIRAALFDIDGTLTSGGEVWGGLLHSPEVRRFKMVWLYGTALPHHLLSKVGIVSQAGFRDRWVRLMAWLMMGWSVEQAQPVYDLTVREYLIPMLRPDMVAILNQHKAAGHPVILVSTMFEGIVERFGAHLGADAALGSRVAFRDGRCLGRIVGQSCSGGRKVEFARRRLAQQFPALSLKDCAAYADSKSDIPFLEGVGYPVATYPDDAMRFVAMERGWRIVDGG
jgi:HAD superfamily hydrolase (TIGR01490 family)